MIPDNRKFKSEAYKFMRPFPSPIHESKSLPVRFAKKFLINEIWKWSNPVIVDILFKQSLLNGRTQPSNLNQYLVGL